ncbi:MAG: hypothetical protein IT222_02075 [Crocinitomix sp.]|nr:hypothetical protein [Crocinitomix sp.]
MIRSNKQYMSNSLEYVYKSEIGERTRYAANTGTTEMSVANSNLNCSCTLYTVLQSNSSNGTLIKTITLNGTKSITKGMERLYTESNDSTPIIDIISEIEIPAISQYSIQESFAISIEVAFILQFQYKLRASIQNGSENIIVIAERVGISYPQLKYF